MWFFRNIVSTFFEFISTQKKSNVVAFIHDKQKFEFFILLQMYFWNYLMLQIIHGSQQLLISEVRKLADQMVKTEDSQ